MQELDAYDSIGMQYYYMGNIDKAIFYHNRMMRGELERFTPEREWNQTALERAREKADYKRSVLAKSIFELYLDSKERGNAVPVLSHEDEEDIIRYVGLLSNIEGDRLGIKKNKHANAPHLLSPKYIELDIKARMMDEAIREAQGEDYAAGCQNGGLVSHSSAASLGPSTPLPKASPFADARVKSVLKKHVPCWL